MKYGLAAIGLSLAAALSGPAGAQERLIVPTPSPVMPPAMAAPPRSAPVPDRAPSVMATPPRPDSELTPPSDRRPVPEQDSGRTSTDPDPVRPGAR